jgi:SsrA-binding protein
VAETKKKSGLISFGIAAQNRKARHDYTIEETFEAGMVLTGPEVKALRHGRATITEAWAGERDGELFLYNAYIPVLNTVSAFQKEEPRRPRKLLLHRKEVSRLIGAVRREGATLVPLSIFFNPRGMAKLSLGLAAGRKKADKRAAIKERDWQRDKARLLANRSKRGE